MKDQKVTSNQEVIDRLEALCMCSEGSETCLYCEARGIIEAQAHVLSLCHAPGSKAAASVVEPAPETDLAAKMVHICTFPDGSRIAIREDRLVIWREGKLMAMTPEQWLTVRSPVETGVAQATLQTMATAISEAEDLLTCARPAEHLEGATPEEWYEQRAAWYARNTFQKSAKRALNAAGTASYPVAQYIETNEDGSPLEKASAHCYRHGVTYDNVEMGCPRCSAENGSVTQQETK